MTRLSLAVTLLTAFARAAQASGDDIAALMARMSLPEKIGQLTMLSAGRDATGPVLSAGAEQKIRQGLAGSLLNAYGAEETRRFQRIAVEQSPRRIPLLFAYDVIHGHRTIFPINLGLSCSWDLDLIERAARRAAAEAWADGLHWTFAPMTDISRDPRWGRVAEGAGEDPWLGARTAEAMVRGFQGPDGTAGLRQPGRIMATVKHFALYGAPDAGRDYNTADMSRHRMFNEYLEPYRAAVAAGAAAVMSSFNEVEGVPATGNRWLLRDLLRGEWGFNGLIISDYTAIAEIAAHGVAGLPGAARLALEAGVDVDMVGETFLSHLPALAEKEPRIAALIDEACRRVLLAKQQLGLFDNPFRPARPPGSPDRALALEAAQKSIVLLKNNRDTLPLAPGEKILFTGPLVHDRFHQLGAWRAAGDSAAAESLGEALAARQLPFVFAPGCPLREQGEHPPGSAPEAESNAMIQEAAALAADCDKAVLLLGEPSGESGEGASKTDIRLPAPQRRLLSALAATGKPLILVLATGRPLAIAEEEPLVSAVLVAWFGGHMAGPALADILYGLAAPQGRLTMSFPRSAGQIPVFYNHKPTGRPAQPDNRYTSRFLDCPNEPLYPFGFGLSYSTVTYSPAAADAAALTSVGSLRVSATLSNTGKRPVVETAQLYIRDLEASVTRPVRELKGFRQVRIEPGQAVRVTFEITEPSLRFYDASLRHRSEPGRFRAWIAPHSAADPGAVEFDLEETQAADSQGYR